MKLADLAAEYRQSAAMLKERIAYLRHRLSTEELCNMDKLRLRIRIETLSSIFRETSEAAVFMERYYDRRYKKNGRFTV